MAAPLNLRLVDEEPPREKLDPVAIDLAEAPPTQFLDDGSSRTENADGSVTFDENPDRSTTAPDEDNFYRNLAADIGDEELGKIAGDLLTGIELDDNSRKEWLQTRATAIRMLGLKLEEPRGDLGTSSAPLEGMSTFRHPALLEATIRFQANARGELLPASGPVKVRNDLPMRPDVPAPPPAPVPPAAAPPPSPTPAGLAAPTAPQGASGGAPAPPSIASPGMPAPAPGPMPGPAPGMPTEAPAIPAVGHNGGPPLAPEGQAMDDLGAALEKDFNHYLTVTATEYVPDTDRMLFYVGFGGDGFKKVYNCPLRRRPVSESVDAENIIVSNAATDIRNCGRVTHRIRMRPSVLKRMQILGEYRDVKIGEPNPAQTISAPEQEKAAIAGVRPQPQQPKDAEYEIFECYCELDIPKFAPKQFKDKGLPLPYVVTLEKESRQVLAVRRNWDEDDEQCLAKQFFVQFPFIRGLGFYGLGLTHILGNITMALTAIIRIMIDNGMFSNFPGFLFAKQAGRQNTNQIRIPPGGGFPVDVPPGMRIQDAFMPAPYKETGQAFSNLAKHIEELAGRLGQTAELNIGEGKQDVPVGTTMALIEQATKIMDSVHKRLHAAQAEEFGLLKERFREDPEAFWRHNRKPARAWTVEQFESAISQRELVPVADPNNPTSLHRIAKATIIDMLMSKYPQLMNQPGGLRRILRIADIDAEGLLETTPKPPPPDPRFAAIMSKKQAEDTKAQIERAKLALQAQSQQAQFADKQTERAFKERMQQYEMYLENMRLNAEFVIHAHDIQRANREADSGIAADSASAVQGMITTAASHQQEMQHDDQRHQQQMQHTDERHDADLEQKRALAAVKPKPTGV